MNTVWPSTTLPPERDMEQDPPALESRPSLFQMCSLESSMTGVGVGDDDTVMLSTQLPRSLEQGALAPFGSGSSLFPGSCCNVPSWQTQLPSVPCLLGPTDCAQLYRVASLQAPCLYRQPKSSLCGL